MKRITLVLVFTFVAGPACADPSPLPLSPKGRGEARAETKLNGHVFTLPAGFEIELIAGPPLVDRPITADFDEQGRLYVSDSSGTNENIQLQLKKKPHRILRLEDTDGDGKFDKRTVFADGLSFPEGTMWYAGSLFVAAPPSIWKLTDTDGDGVADQRSEWFQGKTVTGCANDLHGPYLGPDGWIYWCKGAFAEQTYDRPGKKPFVTKASHIFRCRPDGSGIEAVMTGGMDNPVDVVFTPGGERIFTTTFLVHPGGGNRDGLLHAVYGGIYGKVHDVINGHTWTGPEVMPVLSHLGPAAPCGLVRFESQAFGKDYQDNLFACCFNLQKVTRHVLTPEGASFKSRDEDFLVSSNRDFHPTDILEDADGSLVVVDTGGWYKLCCPTSQLHKPDILGGIYRIRKKGAERIKDPRGQKLAWERMEGKELVKLLDDPRPAVRRRAIEVLGGKTPKEVLPVLTETILSDKSAQARRNALWAATRFEDHYALDTALTVLEDPDESVRQVALHSYSLRRARIPLVGVDKILKGQSLHNRRAAAEALGRRADKTFVPLLLDALDAMNPPDRALEHSLIYALIEIGDQDGTSAGLTSKNPVVRRGVLIALDQMNSPKVTAAAVTNELTSPDSRMKEAALWIAGRHSEWGADLAGYFHGRLDVPNLTAADRDELAKLLGQLSKGEAIKALVADQVKEVSGSLEKRQTLLRAMAQSGLKETPANWIAALVQVLEEKDKEIVREAVATARTFRVPAQHVAPLAAGLLNVAENTRLPVEVRLQALQAVPGGLPKVTLEVFIFLKSHLKPDESVVIRTTAVDVLSRAKLTSEQLISLTGSFPSVGSMELDRLLDAYAQASDEVVGQNLFTALKGLPSGSGLRTDTLKPRVAKFSPKVKQQFEELFKALDAEASKEKAKLEELVASVSGGDIRRGQLVFNSQKAACVACHAIGYLGGQVGPDLTRIGQIRGERDLLEAIVFPSASFVRSYEPVAITTKEGKIHNGVIRKDAPDEITLAIGVNQEVRIPRNEIDEILPSKVSVMPAGLDQQLTAQDLADLVAFLRSCK